MRTQFFKTQSCGPLTETSQKITKALQTLQNNILYHLILVGNRRHIAPPSGVTEDDRGGHPRTVFASFCIVFVPLCTVFEPFRTVPNRFQIVSSAERRKKFAHTCKNSRKIHEIFAKFCESLVPYKLVNFRIPYKTIHKCRVK